jgi:hypothetical protein
MKKKAILFMLVLMFISTNALSQNWIQGQITGDIKEGITVQLYKIICGSDDDWVWFSKSNSEGYYGFGNLANGSYRVVPENASHLFNPEFINVEIPQTIIQSYDFIETLHLPRLYWIGDSIMVGNGTNVDCTNPDLCVGGGGYRDDVLDLVGRWFFNVRGPFGTVPGNMTSTAVIGGTGHISDTGWKRADQVQTAHGAWPGARCTSVPPITTSLPNMLTYFYDNNLLQNYFPYPNPPGSVIIYGLGTNDIISDANDPTREQSMDNATRDFINYVDAYDPSITVIILNLPPKDVRGADGGLYPTNPVNRWVSAYNTDFLAPRITSMKVSKPNLFLCDVNSALYEGWKDDSLTTDGIHLSTEGNTVIAPIISATLVEAGLVN